MRFYYTQKQQSGHAGLMFLLIFPALFGLFVWSTDGARMLQSDARLTDAMEVAVLAVSAQASDENDVREATAKRFINDYFSDVEASNITVTSSKTAKTEGEGDDEKRFFEYDLSVKVERDTIFQKNNGSTLSYGDSFKMGRTAVARKGLSEAVDVVLVSDYSSSMYEGWDGGAQRKFKDLNDIVDEIADELKHYNDQNPNFVNTLSVVGFDYYTSESTSYEVEKCWWFSCWYETVTERMFAHHLICNRNPYEVQRNKFRSLTSDCKYQGVFFEGAIKDSYYVDANATVANIFNLNHPSNQHSLDKSEVQNTSKSVFETIPLSSNFLNIKSIVNDSGRFNISEYSGSGTASYAGLIRAAQIAETGMNPRRLIIILSDGVDSKSSITDKLISAGLCSEIIDTLSEEVVNGNNVRAEMAAIGFDYSVSSNPQMANCVGEERVYSAVNTEDIKNKILSLISEEVGSLVR
ncbi:TadE/TadG family type IV pilus assembly protein [Marinomonas fungiae]|uniref:Putative Flp pilus-assembly TadE/G-like n=1 Tax=Marinomonas fungiae TaxID=1137284 RepID=A0A0K6II24_9GAMM|nr:TadE/TadG family type IV pilus assembly protein [Marinomonas fungiae]CUB02754.1 Putative Flp pilus-assembly TadE/G-like [Marinomonas fungiae]